MLTAYVQNQPALGQIVNGHYVIPPPPEVERYNWRKAVATPPVGADLCFNETKELGKDRLCAPSKQL